MVNSELTLDMINGYYWRLQINTVTNIFVNSICIYLVLNYSTAAMGNYKYYIIFNVVSTMTLDFHISCFHGLLVLFPYSVTCMTGPLGYMKDYRYNAVSYNIMHFTLSATGLSVFIGFLYRYYSLRNEAKVFHTKKAALIIATSIILYPLPSTIPSLINIQYSDAYAKDYAARKYLGFDKIYTEISCSAYYDNTVAVFGFTGSLFLISIVGVACGIIAVINIRLLQSVKSSLTTATYTLQRQFLIVLCFQLVIPSVCLFSPLFVLFGAVLAESKNMFRK